MRLIDADKVYPWYLKAFSAEEIGKDKEIKPNEVKFSMNDIRENLSNIATEQEPKTGHWIIVSDRYGENAYICECSNCKDTVWVYKDADRKWNYCPNCGAKMESEES